MTTRLRLETFYRLHCAIFLIARVMGRISPAHTEVTVSVRVEHVDG